MKRVLFNAMAGTSMLLCVATAVLWCRCKYDSAGLGSDQIYFGGNREIGVFSLDGVLFIGSFWIAPEDAPGHAEFHVVRVHGMFSTSYFGLVLMSAKGHQIGPIGVASYSETNADGVKQGATEIMVADWLLLLLFLLPPLYLAGRTLVDRRRRRSGFCPACGYDLRATPNRCPECGAIPEKEK